MRNNNRSTEMVTRELLKLPPLTLYEIATDIQVSEKWKKFAFAVGFSTENVIMIEMSNNDRFPAENVIYHWFSKNPKVEDLAKILCDLDLEKPLFRLEKYMHNEVFNKFVQKLNSKRQSFTNQDDVLQSFEESNQNNFPADKMSYDTQISNASNASNTSNTSNTSTSVPTTPEPGLISISRCMVSESQKKEMTLDSETEIKNSFSGFSIIEAILNKKSTNFSIDEFNEDFIERSYVGKFGGEFFKKLRGNEFFIKSFCLEKLSESTENQKKLYNNIWCLTNFRLYSLPLVTGFCYFENHLFLIYPNCQTKTLFFVLHRSQKNNNVIISLRERLEILQSVGKVLSFLHCSIPFGACHGNIISKNILIGPNVIQLSGFDKFYTEDPQYLKGFNQISNNEINKTEIKIEDLYKSDFNNYLELICETFWNIQKTEDDLLVDEIEDYEMKIKYQGWNRDIEKKMKAIIQYYTTDSKICPKVEEIVDELNKLDRLSTEPPSYNEIEPFNDVKE